MNKLVNYISKAVVGFSSFSAQLAVTFDPVCLIGCRYMLLARRLPEDDAINQIYTLVCSNLINM